MSLFLQHNVSKQTYIIHFRCSKSSNHSTVTYVIKGVFVTTTCSIQRMGVGHGSKSFNKIAPDYH